MAGSKTLDNGLRVLKLVSTRADGISLSEISVETELHTTVVFRLLQTLESHNLIRRNVHKRYFVSAGLIPLAAAVDSNLHEIAKPVLQELTAKLSLTSYLMVPVSNQEVMAEIVIQPRKIGPFISFSVGSLHSINKGSGGVAILAGRPPKSSDSDIVRNARNEGVAVSTGQVLHGVVGVASPLRAGGTTTEASVGVSFFENSVEHDVELIKAAVRQAAQEISSLL